MSGILSNIYDNVSFALELNSRALARLQEQASTGMRINRPSDDPSTGYRILALNSQDKRLADYIDNLSDVSGTLEMSCSIVQSMTDVVTQAKIDLSQITSGVYNEQDRQRCAEAIDDVLEQLVQLANTRHTGQYLFGGANTAAAPYLVQRTNGKITAVTYQGSGEDRKINVAPGVRSSSFYVGEDLFRCDDRAAPVFVGSTGAKAGSGTSSVTGDVWLTVIHDGSNYKISIDDGATYVTVPAGGSANQPVTDSRTGKVLYVDTTAITATGTDLVRVPGTYDVFNTLITVRDILKNERGLSDSQLAQLRTNALQSMDEINNLLIRDQASMGSRIGFLSNLKDSLENIKFNTEDETTVLEQADIAAVAMDLSRRQVLYQMSLAVAGKLMSLSLLDFIE